MFTGRLNPDSGNPEILQAGKVVAKSSYEGFAFYLNGNEAYIVIGAYYEGEVPSNLVGKLLTVDVTTAREMYPSIKGKHS